MIKRTCCSPLSNLGHLKFTNIKSYIINQGPKICWRYAKQHFSSDKLSLTFSQIPITYSDSTIKILERRTENLSHDFRTQESQESHFTQMYCPKHDSKEKKSKKAKL